MSTCTNAIPGCGCDPIFQVTNPIPPPLQLPVTIPPVPPTTYWNTAQTATAVCPAGSPTLSYTVPANTISLTTNDPNGQSEVDATAAAQAQAQANLMLTQGGCGISGSLSGLKWLMPSTGPTPGRHAVCSDPADIVTTLAGNPGQLYTVTLRIRGIVEIAPYTAWGVGGSDIPSTANPFTMGVDNYVFACSNPTQAVPAVAYPTPGWDGNEYALVISNPPQVFFLNADSAQPDAYCHSIDCQFAVQIYAGATVTLKARSGDGLEEANGYWTIYSGSPKLVSTFQIPAVYTAGNPITASMNVSSVSSLFVGAVIYLNTNPVVVVSILDTTHVSVKNLVAANVGNSFPINTLLLEWLYNVSSTDNDPNHPIGVLQPFDGQFIQMDVISIS